MPSVEKHTYAVELMIFTCSFAFMINISESLPPAVNFKRHGKFKDRVH